GQKLPAEKKSCSGWSLGNRRLDCGIWVGTSHFAVIHPHGYRICSHTKSPFPGAPDHPLYHPNLFICVGFGTSYAPIGWCNIDPGSIHLSRPENRGILCNRSRSLGFALPPVFLYGDSCTEVCVFCPAPATA